MADDVISIKVIAESSSVDKTNKSVDNLASTLLKTEKEALKIRKAFKLLDSAVNSGKINHQKYSKMVNKLNVQETILYKNLGKTTNAVGQQSASMSNAAQNAKKFADAQRLAGKSTNKFGMYAQQVGYQVGDFFVQVQSGTSALVAFGQQGTQLAGLLPGVAGAVIGIGLSLGTMLLKTFLDTKDAGKQLEESIKGVENALSNLSNVSSMLRDTLGAPFSEANTQLKEYLELLEKSSAAKVQDAIALAFGAKGESTGILNELKVLADDMTKPPWWAGEKFGGSEKEIEDAEELLRVRGEIAEILRGTAEQPRVIEGTEGLRELGDDLLAYSKQFNGALGERIRTLMFEAGLTQLMVDAEKAKGDAADATTKKQLAFIDDLLKAAEKAAAEAKRATEQQAREEIKVFESVNTQRSNANMALERANIAQLRQAGDLINARDREKQLVMKIAAAQVEAVGGTAAQQIEAAKLAEEILKIKHDMEDAALAAKVFEEAIKNASGSGRGADPRKFMEGSPIGWLTPEVLKKYKEFMAEQNKGKGKEPKTMEGPIKALERQIELSKALFGLEDHARRKEEVYMQLKFQNQDADIKASENELRSLAERVALEEQRTKVLEEQNKVIEEQRQQQEALADSIASTMGDAFTSIVDGTMSVKDAFKSMARAIIKELYEVLIVQQLVGSAKAGSRSGIAGGIMNFFGSANGNAMYGGNVIPFASGGVVGSPTTFPMSAGRTGLMGEAGPEAIMPLKRGANGKLGVQSEGGSGDVVIHQNFNFAANGDESVKKLIAQAAPQIANMTKSSIISDRRRGGQMKATFG
jgi:phage-related minor tail protein